MRPFEVVLTLPAAQFIIGLPRSARRRTETWLERLARQPQSTGDFIDVDRLDREHHVKLIGDCLVTWWVDHAAREIRVVEVEAVDDV